MYICVTICGGSALECFHYLLFCYCIVVNYYYCCCYICCRPNPIINLFTGQCVTEGLLNDQPFVNKSQFGAFPVQVEGHTDLHDSLEAATVNNEIQQEVR